MAGIRRQKKMYSRPRKPFDSERIAEENEVLKKYGLKNKREIWKADAAVNRLRKIAKGLITATNEEQEAFITKQIAKGFLKAGSHIDDVLGMTKEDYLERRLQTVVFKKKMGKSLKHARQLVTHKYIRVSGKAVDVPSYVVNLKEEQDITMKPAKVKAAPKPVLEVTEKTNAEPKAA